MRDFSSTWLLVHLNERQPKSAWMALMKAYPEFFGEAVDLALSDKHPEGWRCAWLVSHIMHNNDQRIQPLVLKMIQSLKRIRSGHQREMLNPNYAIGGAKSSELLVLVGVSPI